MPKRRRGPEDQGGDRGQTKDLKDLRELDAFVGEFPPATENPGDDPGRENPREAGDKDVDRVVDAVVESNGGEGVAENEIDRRIGVAANELLMQKGKPRYSQAQAETWMRGMSERQRIEFARRMRNILEQKPVVPKREPASPPKKVEKRDDVAEGGAKGMRRLESDAVNAYYQKKLAGGTQEELDAILAQFGGQGVASAVLNTIPGRVDRLIVPAEGGKAPVGRQKDASDDERNKRERREKSPEGRTIEEKAIALRRVRDGKLREIANALSGNRIDEDQAAQTRRQIEKEYQEAMGLLGPEAQKFLSRETISPTVASADVRIGSGERQRSPERRKEIVVEGEKEREKERKRKFEERWNATGKRFNAEKFRINPDTVKEMKGLIEEVQQIFVAEEGRKFISKNKKEFASVIGDVDPNELDGDRVWELVWNRQDFRGQIEGSLKWNQLDGLRDMLGKYSKGDLPPEVRVLLFKELSRAQGVRQEVLVELWEKIEGRKLDEQARQGLGTPEDYMQVRQQEILVSQKLAERRTKILVDHAIAMGGTGHVLSLDESEMQRIADDLAQVFKGEAYINQDALYALLEQGYNIRETKKKTGAFWIFGAGDVKLKNRNGETKIIKAKEVRVFFSGLNEKLANETAKEVQAILSEEWKGRFEANKASLISAMAERMPESIVAEIYSKVREELEADFLRQYAEEKKKKGPGQKLEQRLKAEGKDLGALAEKALELSGQDLSEEDQEEAIRGLMGEFGFGVDDAAWGAVKGGRQYATLKQYAAKGKMGWFDGLLKFFDSFVK